MGSNDEMMVTMLMEEEAVASAERKKRLILLVALLQLRAKRLPPCIGGSVKGKSKNIDRRRAARAQILADDYFKEGATHPPKKFRCRFRMNKETFRNIVQGVWEYDTYFLCKKDCT